MTTKITDRVPPRIPDFELIRLLGSGHFGDVWLARSKTVVHHAIKVVPKGRVEEIEFQGLRDFEVLARKHPGLVEIRHVGELPDALYYVMELADGYETAPTFSEQDYVPRTLEMDLKRSGTLPLEDAVKVAVAIADGLEHLHNKGLLHRDVKPGNIMFVDGKPKLCDLGLLTVRDRRENEAGTPTYMPPETVVDPGGDVFCLGKTLFEMVTGAPASSFPELPADISDEALAAYKRIAPIIDRACSPDRQERFQSAREFQAALMSVEGLQVAPPETAGRSGAPWVWLSAAAIVLAGVFVGAGLMQKTQAGTGTRIDGSLYLVYAAEEKGATMIVDAEHRPVPLKTGGEITVKARLVEEAFAMIAYCDEESGEVQILYPKAGEEPVAAYEHSTGRFPLDPPATTMTFVLIASTERFEDMEALADELEELGAPPHCSGPQLLTLDQAGIPKSLLATVVRTRGVNPAREDTTRELADPKPGMLLGLHEKLSARFGAIRALSVPQEE